MDYFFTIHLHAVTVKALHFENPLPFISLHLFFCSPAFLRNTLPESQHFLEVERFVLLWSITQLKPRSIYTANNNNKITV